MSRIINFQNPFCISLSKYNRSTSTRGFTLTELLIASLLVPLSIVVLSQIFISQVNTERQLSGSQSSENLRSRLSFLIESDVADGRIIELSSTGCPSIAGKLFDIRSPYLASNGLSILETCITYANSGGALIRRGPRVLQNGSLDYSSQITETVSSDTSISGISINPTSTKIEFNIAIPSFLGTPSKTYQVSYGTKNLRVGT